MMWTILKPKSGSTLEPVELRDLKEKLARLSCKCLTERSKSVFSVLDQNDKQVQVEERRKSSFDRFTQVNSDTISKERRDFINALSKDVLCPTCFVTMNLLRGGMLKILKDEESEAKADMFTCDKSTEKRVRAVEKTTSVTSKPLPKYSNLTLCDFMSESSSVSSLRRQHDSARSPHQVKFLDVTANAPHQSVPMHGACLCLDNYIDSIRPPLLDAYYLNQ